VDATQDPKTAELPKGTRFPPPLALEVFMLRSLLTLPAVLASVLVLGCGEQPAPSEPANTPRPSLRTEQSPDGLGATVIRFDDRLIFLIQDQGRGITIGLGLTPQDLEALLAACPNELPAPEEIPTQVVVRPDDVTKYLAKGELSVIIWPAVIFSEFGLCAEEDLPPILAAGTVRFIESVSDFNLSLTRANAVVAHAHGTVTDLLTGQEFRLLVNLHFVVGPDFKFFNAPRFDIILTPTRS
jgi:hypothetical protein